MEFLYKVLCISLLAMAVARQTVNGARNATENDEETTVYPREVKFHKMSATYLLLTFKIPFEGDILYFDLATASNDSSCEMDGYALYSNYMKPVRLSACDGIAGVLKLAESKYLNFLPVLEDNAVIDVHNLANTQHVLQVTDSTGIGMVADLKERKRHRRGWGSATLIMLNTSGRYVLIYYMTNGQRRYHTRLRVNEKIAIVSYVGTTWYAYDRKEQPILMNNRFQFFVHPTYRNREVNIKVHAKTRYTTEMRLKNLPQMRERYMEVVVFGDATFLNFYKDVETAEKYVKALMNSVNRIYRHKSLDTSLHIVLKKVVFEKNWYRLKLPENNAKKALRMACKYAFDWKKQYREQFDFGVILTKTRFGVSGYAPVYRMCVEYKSCTLVSDSGFNSAFIIAHEMAHSVGVLHDGDSNRCRNAARLGSLMSPTIYSTYFRYHWSNCSKITMRENLRYFNCLNDKPSYYKFNEKELPGAKFDLDQQCRFRMGKGHSACLGRRDPDQYCRYMFCRRPRSRTPGKITCTYWSLAPPDGTICAKGSWCVGGKCLPKGRLAPHPINGAWSSWTDWDKCRGKCGRGVQFRHRKCNKPRPSFGGKECSGKDEDWKVCDKGACTVRKVFSDIRLEECFRLGVGWDWLKNTDAIQSVNDFKLNCTFENGSCDWDMGNDEKKSFIVGKGKTPTENTGPYHDHTFKNNSGNYLFMEASYPRRRGDSCVITSPPLFVYSACLRFYYFMMGIRVGSLVVYARYNNGGRKALWNVTGDKGDQWLQGEVTLSEKQEFKIVIESTVGYNYLSDIAIDDITTTDGACKKGELTLDPCAITCVHAEDRLMKHNYTIKDGVKCYEGRDDLCVRGTCEAVGCDGVKGSTKQFDKCKVCGGDGSTCVLVNTTVSVKPTSLDSVVVELPSGSTNIKVKKNLNSIGFIAAKSGKDNYYYNQPPPFFPWYYFKMATSSFRYQVNENVSQTIYADGPLSKSVEIKLVFRSYDFKKSPPIDVDVSFYAKNDSSQSVFVFKRQEKTNCTRQCGGGNYSINFGCFSLKENKFVGDEKCLSTMARPKTEVNPCNEEPCKIRYQYTETPWGSCTICNKMGARYRNATCTVLEEGKDPQAVDDSFCKDVVKPKTEKQCYLYCPYAHKKCAERSKRCPEMIRKGYCRYRSVQLLCCETCSDFYMISPGSYIIA